MPYILMFQETVLGDPACQALLKLPRLACLRGTGHLLTNALALS